MPDHPPIMIQGIPCYAPELAYANDQFPGDSFTRLSKAEENHFWFRVRNRIILSLFKKFAVHRDAQVLEIGCGTGFVLRGLHAAGYRHLTGTEIHLSGLTRAARQVPEATFVQLDARRLPFKDRFDAIGLFDTLEHIEEDRLVLEQARAALRVQGLLFLTVPQHRFLWSPTDDVAMHKRRYARRELVEKVEAASMRVRYVGSFMFTLFPLLCISRWLLRARSGGDPFAELQISPLRNQILERLLAIDALLIRRGWSLPWGGSLILVAEKI